MKRLISVLVLLIALSAFVFFAGGSAEQKKSQMTKIKKNKKNQFQWLSGYRRWGRSSCNSI